jgi:hypothetical protein
MAGGNVEKEELTLIGSVPEPDAVCITNGFAKDNR